MIGNSMAVHEADILNKVTIWVEHSIFGGESHTGYPVGQKLILL